MRRMLAVMLVVGLLGCSNEEPPDEIAVHVNRESAGEQGADGWFEARSQRGGFTVRLPAKFNDFNMQMKGDDGRTVHLYGVSVDTGGVRYSASATRRVDGSAADMRVVLGLVDDLRRSGMLKTSGGVAMAGRQGIDVMAVDGEMATRMRAVAAGPAIFQLVVEYPAAKEAQVAADIAKFFGSFELTGGAAK